MVGYTTPAMQAHLLKILLAISEGKSDEAADVAIRISRATVFQPAEFGRRIRQLLAVHQGEGLRQMNVGRIVLEVSRIAADNGLFVPSELTLLGKTLLQLDEVGRILDPAFDTSASVRRNATQILSPSPTVPRQFFLHRQKGAAGTFCFARFSSSAPALQSGPVSKSTFRDLASGTDAVRQRLPPDPRRRSGKWPCPDDRDCMT